MRKTYDKAFKARVALEALKGEKTIQELGQIHGVHPTLITQWKKLLVENAAELFERPGKVSDEERQSEEQKEQMLRQLGQMTLENEFLKKSTSNCTGTMRSCRPRRSRAVGQSAMPDPGRQPVCLLLRASARG